MRLKLFLILSLSILITASAAAEVENVPNLNSYPNLPYKEFVFPPAENSSCHSPSITELPDGELFAVWYAPTKESRHASIWGSRKPAGAGKWSEPFVIQSTPGHSNKNPVIYLTKENNLLLFWGEEKRWIKWPRDRIMMKISRDLGRTWGNVTDFGTPVGFLPRNHPITLKDGRILIPVYTDWSTSSAIYTSKDGGFTWSGPTYILFFFGIQPTVIQRADLSLFALTRSGMWPRYSWQAVSHDLGRHWREQRPSNVKNPGFALEMIKLKSGNVVLIFNNSRTSRDTLSLALSHDDGRTWPHIRVIESIPGRIHGYPSIIQDKKGLIHIVYSYSNRNGIAHFVTNEQWITAQNSN